MKSTFLVYKNHCVPEEGLRTASKDEWNQILQKNKELPRNSRRFFIEDRICDTGETDVMFIETSRVEYDKWHKETAALQRRKEYKKGIKFVSGDATVDAENTVLFDTVSNSEDMVESLISNLMLEELRKELSLWKWWATDFLDLYIDGCKKESTKILSKKYGISEQKIREKKRKFEDYVIAFYQKNA